MTRLRITSSFLLLVAGCGGFGGGSTLTESPAKWDDYADKTITVRGTAGNSHLGPIVRFADGGYIALRSRDPWGFDARNLPIASRPVEVTGRVVSGQGFRAEKYVLEPTTINLLPDAPPESGKGGS